MFYGTYRKRDSACYMAHTERFIVHVLWHIQKDSLCMFYGIYRKKDSVCFIAHTQRDSACFMAHRERGIVQRQRWKGTVSVLPRLFP